MPYQVWIFPILKGKNEHHRTSAEKWSKTGAKVMHFLSKS
jgi:hypothetical protein